MPKTTRLQHHRQRKTSANRTQAVLTWTNFSFQGTANLKLKTPPNQFYLDLSIFIRLAPRILPSQKWNLFRFHDLEIKAKQTTNLKSFPSMEKSFFLLLFFFSSDDKVGEKRFVWLKWCLLFHCEHIFWLGSFSASESQVSVSYSFFLLQQRCWRNVIRCLNALEKKLINYWKGSF